MSEVLHKSCDACRARKIRCKMASGDACESCMARRSRCCFSYIKRPRRRKCDAIQEPLTRQSPAEVSSVLGHSSHLGTGSTLYIDSLLEDRQSSRIPGSAEHPDQLTAIFGPNPNISFFPTRRVRSINERLGHDRLEQVLAEIRDIVAAKVKMTSSISRSRVFQEHHLESAHHVGNRKLLNEHISVYYAMVHPLYPFLCEESFQRQITAPELVRILVTDKAFAALYYAILAIGCQHNEGGSFEAGVGEAWSYFERSISYFQDVVFFRGSLTAVQALMAMAIFSSTVSAFQFESLMLSEAAIMAQGLGFNRSNNLHDSSNGRTFWVLYFMEKVACFTTGRISVLQDSNISCSIPKVKESAFHDYDWFFSFLRYARLVAKIHDSLFTISSMNQSDNHYNANVQRLILELEAWRVSVPERFRAGEPLKPRLLHEPLSQTVALTTHYLYFNAQLTLCWTLLHCSAAKLGAAQQIELKQQLMRTARSVLELTKFIEVAPSTPIWILGVLPLSCLMILFDIVVHNPDHPETNLSLALLDIAGGHFSRLEFASKGTLPGSLIGQFAHLARQYVFENRRNKHKGQGKASDIRVRDSVGYEQAEGLGMTRGIPTPAVELSPTIATALNPSTEALPTYPQELLTVDPNSVRAWNTATLPGSDQLFIPLIDDPSYRVGELELLGIDLKDLFDYPYAILGSEAGG